MIKIAGIKRKKIYSPNHVINDALIFSKTVERLNQLDVSVEIYEEDDVERIKEELIFSGSIGRSPTGRNMPKKSLILISKRMLLFWEALNF